jgi:hypothetical protein
LGRLSQPGHRRGRGLGPRCGARHLQERKTDTEYKETAREAHSSPSMIEGW